MAVRDRGVPTAGPAAAQAKITEKQFQSQVVQYARLVGWEVYHPYLSIRSAPGFPDLTLVRAASLTVPGRVIFAELKTAGGRVSHTQRAWGDLLGAVGGNVAYFLWRPDDWAEIERVLGGTP